MKIDLTFIRRFKYRSINKSIVRNRRGEIVINIYTINKGVRKIKGDIRKVEFYKINKKRVKFEIKRINKRTNEVIINIYIIFFIIEILYKERVILIIKNLEISITCNIVFINNFFDINIIFIKHYIRNFKLIF